MIRPFTEAIKIPYKGFNGILMSKTNFWTTNPQYTLFNQLLPHTSGDTEVLQYNACVPLPSHPGIGMKLAHPACLQ